MDFINFAAKYRIVDKYSSFSDWLDHDRSEIDWLKQLKRYLLFLQKRELDSSKRQTLYFTQVIIDKIINKLTVQE